MLAKTLVQIRGGPDVLLSANPPQRTTFGSGIMVSTARLLLEHLAVYDAFGKVKIQLLVENEPLDDFLTVYFILPNLCP